MIVKSLEFPRSKMPMNIFFPKEDISDYICPLLISFLAGGGAARVGV